MSIFLQSALLMLLMSVATSQRQNDNMIVDTQPPMLNLLEGNKPCDYPTVALVFLPYLADIQNCTTDSKYPLVPPVSYPTAEQTQALCTQPTCTTALNSLVALDLPNCTVAVPNSAPVSLDFMIRRVVASMLRVTSKLRQMSTRSTTASGSTVYESDRAAHEYLQFHFGDSSEVVPYSFAPADALQFLPRCVQDSVTHLPKEHRRQRALEVVGIDFSHHFIEVANGIKATGSAEYEALIQGDVKQTRLAKVAADIDRSKVTFTQGDACNLDTTALGSFDLVFASNLLCRLPQPKQFLDTLPSLVRPNGLLALISPYSWLEEYTPKEHWIGGTVLADGTAVDSFAEIQRLLAPHFTLVDRTQYPFLIREHDRKFQYGVSDGTFWRRV
ncbi:hypothetical protein DYB25_011296 [Aphanomyces astaci]|uniref:Methyltransferase type 11 domain-containing protein n=1 Tax=Aphanomyces astaci TaxID=112090 RepID=A0A397A7G2_APHAT|nr:hypothetical protein DYB25_011296 [Aphanomyces astaci]